MSTAEGGQDLARVRQARGDLSSVRLTTPGGVLSGPYALDVFEAIQRGRR